jgi:hypothetical protein
VLGLQTKLSGDCWDCIPTKTVDIIESRELLDNIRAEDTPLKPRNYFKWPMSSIMIFSFYMQADMAYLKQRL